MRAAIVSVHAPDTTRSRFATQAIAEAIADEAPIDWTPAERALGPDAPALASLHLIEDVARAFRESAPPTATQAQALFAWGPLQVRERLGEGMTGEVYRAFDPALQREVALKLRAQRDPAHDPGNGQLLAEARRLARIRQRNVLSVFGAAVHDGRAGIWSELIEGRTLAERVATDGPLGADETIAIGLDLCRALGAVHGAGLVHGDIKAENVMRERGGRIVLMDFGASSGRADSGERLLLAGTRRYLPPEVLDGRTGPGPGCDLYALGVLLHFLLSGHFPCDDAETGPVALAGRRPDLPDALLDFVQRAIADDPALRPGNATAFARELLVLRPDHDTTPRHFRWWPWLATTAVAAAVAMTFIGLQQRPAPPGWSVSARLLDTGTGMELSDGNSVRLGDLLALELTASVPAHIYVLNEDSDGELTVLFPADDLELANPVAAGATTRLPGRMDGREMSWQVSSPSAAETFVLIAAERPSSRLDERMRSLSHVQSPPDDDATRGTTRLRHRASWPHALEDLRLAELVALAEADADDDAGNLHVKVWRLRHAEH